MTNEELSATLFLLGYVALFIAAVRVFGLGRVLSAIFLIVFLAVAAAFKSLGAITGARRY